MEKVEFHIASTFPVMVLFSLLNGFSHVHNDCLGVKDEKHVWDEKNVL